MGPINSLSIPYHITILVIFGLIRLVKIVFGTQGEVDFPFGLQLRWRTIVVEQ